MRFRIGRRPTTPVARLSMILARGFGIALLAISASAAIPGTARGEDAPASAASRFRDEIEPILADHCYGCHGNGLKKGGVTLDAFATDAAILARPELWHDVLKNVRAGLMPPADKPRPSSEEVRALEDWIKRGAFGLDPADPDPGRVTLRRLNRVEYRNTIRDLMGIDFRTDEEFPADDTGYGFDNVGDVLSVSTLLLEKYMQAAEAIVASAVPTVSRVVQSRVIPGGDFREAGSDATGERLSMYKPAKVSRAVSSAKGGPHRLVVEIGIRANFDFDPGRARLTLGLDGKELLSQEFGWEGGKKFRFEYAEALKPGDNVLTFTVTPLTPPDKKRSFVNIRIASVTVEGPMAESEWVRPDSWARFFDRDDPKTPDGRRDYARDVLRRFASKGFRKPVNARTLGKLVAIAEEGYSQPDSTVERGIARAMVAVLASPRFLFRVEETGPGESARGFAPVDEYALASRLSYFLWSSMPDDELIGLAARGELRKVLPAQVKRMLADGKSEALVQNFTGQWLQARDFEHFPIQARAVLRRDGLPGMMDSEVGELRRSMRMETEAFFAHVLREDRPILDFLDSDYAVVNETLAKLYGIPGVSGREFRRVALPEGTPRGGLLTQAGILMITSNPNRTSPVKRGQFILENILGTPTPPPPPDIPSLEDALKGFADRQPSMREVMEIHRRDPLCASCHNRMDPLGLALENFNAMGIFRAAERKVPIDASGKLVTGRTFKDVVELKRILKTAHRTEFYQCLTEKLLTYALGRGLDYYDVEAVDRIVARLDREDGRFSALLSGVIESAPFQKRRNPPALTSASSVRSHNPPAPGSHR